MLKGIGAFRLQVLALLTITLIALAPLLGFAPTKSSKKTTTKKPVAKKSGVRKTAGKKSTTKRWVARRASVFRPPVVSPKVRQASQEFVNDAMDAVAAAAVENSAALVPFFEQLYQLETKGSGQRSLHVLQYGDSHTASDDWANQLRILFQGRFGNGGAGFSLAGRPFAGYRRRDVKSGQTDRWETEGLLSRGSDGFYGLGGAAVLAERSGQMVYLDADGEKIELHYLRQPGGGSFRILIDEVEAQVIDTNGSLGPGVWTSQLGEGLRRFTVETLSDQPVKLFGWVSERERGLTWETLGINGAQANISLRWEAQHLGEYLAKRNPGLLVLAYGTNEAGGRDWNPENYREMFREVVARFRNLAPQASILIVGPPDRAHRVRRTWIGMPKLDMIAEAQRSVAQELGCAFWDLRERMGGDGAMKRWVFAGFAQGDFVHFTGEGYRLVGETMYRDLMAHYEEFRKIRLKVFGEGEKAGSHGQTGKN